ncbi:MAG: amidohydrolase family protein [Christensenellales bacterium]|nr:amidohydrolase family protein [Christensenellales bacterium]
MEGKNFVIRGNICHCTTRTEIDVVPNGYVVCEEGRSQGVFHQLPERYAELPVTDFGDRLVIPGMVDLHTHAPQFAFRGMGMDMELMDWLQTYTFPGEAKYADEAYAEKAYDHFVEKMRTSATTRACIFATCHVSSTILLMKKMDASGLVSFVGKVNMDLLAPDWLREESAKRSIEETWRWLREVGNLSHTQPILSPRFVPSCSEKLLIALGNLRREWNLPVQSHLSENHNEIQLVRQMYPESPFYGAIYDQYDLFGVDSVEGTRFHTVMAHCVWSSEREAARIRENGVFIAHCPGSNTNLASGIAPLRRYLEQGLRVGLGSDVAGGHTESIFQAIIDGIQGSKMYQSMVDPGARFIHFPEALYLATRGGGAFFGKVGCFEPGYELDAVVLDDSVASFQENLPLSKRLERAVYQRVDRDGICAKYVRGKRLF